MCYLGKTAMSDYVRYPIIETRLSWWAYPLLYALKVPLWSTLLNHGQGIAVSSRLTERALWMRVGDGHWRRVYD